MNQPNNSLLNTEQKLQILKQQYLNAKRPVDRKLLVLRAKFLKAAEAKEKEAATPAAVSFSEIKQIFGVV